MSADPDGRSVSIYIVAVGFEIDNFQYSLPCPAKDLPKADILINGKGVGIFASSWNPDVRRTASHSTARGPEIFTANDLRYGALIKAI
jgi:hypothetical protein